MSAPGVGDTAPEFSLTADSGDEVSLSGLRAGGSVVVVFVRSADWCPFCRDQLRNLEKNRAAIEAAGGHLVALSYDNVEVQAAAAKKLGLNFPLLADPESHTIKAFGILNKEAKGDYEGLPHPAIFVVDTDGIIRAKLMEEGYRDRPSAELILAALAKID